MQWKVFPDSLPVKTAYRAGPCLWCNGRMDREEALHAARALVLADLHATGITGADTVSLVEEAVAHRRWWVEQWPEGAVYVAGLVAQDVQDALLDRHGRWPLCPLCAADPDEAGAPHALEVEPELGEDPHWVCVEQTVVLAPVGGLGGFPRPSGEGTR